VYKNVTLGHGIYIPVNYFGHDKLLGYSSCYSSLTRVNWKLNTYLQVLHILARKHVRNSSFPFVSNKIL
jgi:hypothetical protein